MSYPIYYVEAGDTLPILFDSYDGGTGASITLTGLAVTDIEIYKDGSNTTRASDSGYALLGTDGIDEFGTGIHGFSIDLSDNTDAGFFAVGSWYHVVIASVTIDAQTVNFIAAGFRIVSATRGMAGTALPDAAADAGGGLPISDAGGLDVDTMNSNVSAILTDTGTTLDNLVDDLESRLGVPSNLGSGATIAANLVDIEAQTDDIGAAGAGLTAVPWNAAWDAQVQSEVTDGLNAYDPPTYDELEGFVQLLARSDAAIEMDRSALLSAINANEGSGAGDYSAQSDSVEAIRDRGDAAWTTGAGGSLNEILNVQLVIPTSIDLANTATYRLAIKLIDAYDDLPSTAEITPGTIDIDRKAIGGTSWSSVVSGAACSESAGLIYYDEVFDSGTGYGEGDSIRVTFRGQSISASGNTYEITDATGWAVYTEIRQTERGTDSAYTGTPPTAVQIRQEIDSNSTQLSAIVTDTAEIGAAGAGLTEAGGTGDQLTAVPWNVAWDAEVQSEATDALNAYDPPTRAELTSDISGLNDLDAAGIRSALGLAAANLDTQLTTIDDFLDTEVAAILEDTGTTIPALIAALNNLSAAQVNAEVVDVIRTDTIPDSVAADGSASTIAQAIYLMLQFLTEKAVSGTTVTVRKPDGSTSLATFTLDDGSSPTSITRAS